MAALAGAGAHQQESPWSGRRLSLDSAIQFDFDTAIQIDTAIQVCTAIKFGNAVWQCNAIWRGDPELADPDLIAAWIGRIADVGADVG